MKTALPAATDDALEHADLLARMLREAIERDGPMPFPQWMARCLYEPGLGYYSAGSRKFGEGGDFVTAPELGSLFAQCVVQAVAPALAAPGDSAMFVELGGGSGAFAVDALRELDRIGVLPSIYAILEPSADLRERQRTRALDELPASLSSRLQWLDSPPAGDWQGVLFANEVVDALPVTRFAMIDGEVHEEHVDWCDDGFVRIDRPADIALVDAVRDIERALGCRFENGYRSELLPQLPVWIESVAGTLRRGVALFVDYGYPRRDYYHPQRRDGTLACHYRHRVHADALWMPGLQDITASIDFSALADAGIAAGFDLVGYATQAQFLIANGLAEAHQRAAADDDALALYRLSQQIRRLTLPDQMGERFQCMAFARGIAVDAWPPFDAIDERERL